MTILVFSPHYDDEVVGCGGFLASTNETKHVSYFTEADALRSKEGENAAKILKFYFRVYAARDGYLYGGNIPEMVQFARNEIYSVSPDYILIPYRSLHQDHITVNQISLIASKDSQATILSYEYPEGGTQFNHFTPNFYVPLTEKQLQKKCEAMLAYKSQVKTTRDVDAIRALAVMRGMECGCPFAEAYQVQRIVKE